MSTESLAALLRSSADYSRFLESIDRVLAASDQSISTVRQSVSELIASPLRILAADESKCRLLSSLLERLSLRQVSFEEQIAALRELLSSTQESIGLYEEAAQTLMGLPLDRLTQSVLFKFRVLVKIVRLLLETVDELQNVSASKAIALQAESYLNRAAMLVHGDTLTEPGSPAPTTEPPSSDIALELLAFKVCQARLYDLLHRYPEASQKYHQLSTAVPSPTERRLALEKSIISAILSDAGSERAKLISLLINDERISRPGFLEGEQDEDHATLSPEQRQNISKRGQLLQQFLKKVNTEELLPVSLVESFGSLLSAHQVSVSPDSDGMSAFERAVLGHNLLSISRIYKCVPIERLAELLGIDVGKTGDVCARMMREGRIVGYMDLQARMVRFRVNSFESVEKWNQEIANLCHHLNQIVDNSITGTQI